MNSSIPFSPIPDHLRCEQAVSAWHTEDDLLPAWRDMMNCNMLNPRVEISACPLHYLYLGKMWV